MQIEVNERDNSLIIKDDLKSQYLLIKLVLILALANSTINLLLTTPKNYSFLSYIWIFMGIVSGIALTYFLLKKSAATHIKVEEIEALREKAVLGRSRFSLLLKNGKIRDLLTSGDPKETKNIKSLFTQLKIAIH